MTSPDFEGRLAELWAELDTLDEASFLARMDALTAELPPASPVAAFERAGARDSTGHPDQAVPLYRQALAQGLGGGRRRQATIQLASSLRNLGQVDESIRLLEAERQRPVGEAEVAELDDAVVAFLALALVDGGREREALSLALGALARHLPRYSRSLARYAAALIEADPPA